MVAADKILRHDWVWLAPDPVVIADDPAAVLLWSGGGHPLVAARRGRDDPPGSVRLGLSLPGRRRIGLTVLPSAVLRRSPPSALQEVRASAPADWRPALDALGDIARANDLPIAVYGSLAWQHISGRPYLTSASDVDLLFRPADWPTLTALLDWLPGLERRFKQPRLDGEVIFPTGLAVAWRELAAGADRILVKSQADAILMDRDSLPALFAQSAA